ncbi:UDP-N-acetylmuramoyl-tripeptide--D-alanyl-D-alanine ligase [Streptacidiphilus sp. MAP5-52]|uniref:UDP-N-acetylmuramoyl-tripeptide--D-alanyl-D- alanine ligase n=1 Tax=Streptacidiphilus sp. MAP5-52 TaxID=3156267 RepID=UPI00351566F9
MTLLTLAEIAALTEGNLHDAPDPQRTVGPFQFDSRRPEPGGLFLCLRGVRDGHQYAPEAVRSGAVAALAEHPVGVPAVVVPDVGAALRTLTLALSGSLAQRGVRTVAVTGSAGKTSTKDLLAQLLPVLGPTTSTAGNFNNELGLPVTLSRAAAEPVCDFLVLEMGARGVGHLRDLTAMAPPLDVAVVLNVGTAHVGEFGSKEQIAQAKGELVEALPAGGWAVLNADDPLVAGMAARTRGEVVWFGRGPSAEVRAEDVRLDAHGQPGFVLHTLAGSARVQLRLLGEHQVHNALAAAATATALGMTPEQTAHALSTAEPITAGRGQRIERADGITVINDAYNANPESVLAALNALAAVARPTGRRPVAVLGAMLERGDAAPQAHTQVGARAAELRVLLVAVGGKEARWLADGAGHAHVADTADQALILLGEVTAPGDVVLFKGSRDAGLQGLSLRFAAAGPAS